LYYIGDFKIDLKEISKKGDRLLKVKIIEKMKDL